MQYTVFSFASRMRLQMVMSFCRALYNIKWYREEVITEIAGLYGAGGDNMPGPFSLKEYIR